MRNFFCCNALGSINLVDQLLEFSLLITVNQSDQTPENSPDNKPIYELPHVLLFLPDAFPVHNENSLYDSTASLADLEAIHVVNEVDVLAFDETLALKFR